MTVRHTALVASEHPGVPESLLRSLNEFHAQVAAALSSSSAANLAAVSVSFTLDERQTFPVRVLNTLPPGRKVLGVTIQSATDLTAKGSPQVSLGNPGWYVFGDHIQLTSISGLTAGHKYRISLLVLGR